METSAIASNRQLIERAFAFDQRLRSHKAAIGPPRGYNWYPYDILGSVEHIADLLGDAFSLVEIAAGRPVADIGCADGDLAFFLESLGARVLAVDFPGTNCNHMAGIRAMKDALSSAVEIYPLDLDESCELPRRDYGAVFLLGTLYHLKNPLLTLEALSRSTDYLFLSTRVTRTVPGLSGDVSGSAVAYLLEAGELNADSTNYWIFSPAALERLLNRTGWRILRSLSVGPDQSSDPVSPDHDERTFCLAQSLAGLRGVTLQRGWYDEEGSGWRWTEGEFSALGPRRGTARQLILRFFLPDPLIERLGAVTLSARVNGIALPGQTYRDAGDHQYARLLPLEIPGEVRLELEFALDRVLPAEANDLRERGLVVTTLRVE